MGSMIRKHMPTLSCIIVVSGGEAASLFRVARCPYWKQEEEPVCSLEGSALWRQSCPCHSQRLHNRPISLGRGKKGQ